MRPHRAWAAPPDGRSDEGQGAHPATSSHPAATATRWGGDRAGGPRRRGIAWSLPRSSSSHPLGHRHAAPAARGAGHRQRLRLEPWDNARRRRGGSSGLDKEAIRASPVPRVMSWWSWPPTRPPQGPKCGDRSDEVPRVLREPANGGLSIFEAAPARAAKRGSAWVCRIGALRLQNSK